MSYFAKGDFKLQESWQNPKKPQSREKSREKNPIFMNMGKNIVQPSTDLLDDDICKRILKDFESQIPPPSSGKSNKKIENEDSKKYPPKKKPQSVVGQSDDLLTSMANRLKQVQLTCNNQRQQIKQKNSTIQKLKMENAFYKGMKDDSATIYKQMEEIKANNEGLQKKVIEMETYLKQYGLKWVGHKIQGKLEHDQLKKDISKKYNYQLPSEIDINTINRRIADLNASLHAEGHGSEIYIQNGIHKFRPAEPLTMGFYGDGIAIKGFKFFPYNSKDSLRILSDLLEGYFPYVLKHKYPNGVFLKVLDFIGKKYNDESQKGPQTFQSAEEKALKAPSKEEFLNKLPNQVIKNGKVINIRGEIQKRLNGEQQIHHQAQQLNHFEQVQGCLIFKTQIHAKIKSKQVSSEEIAQVKIRTDTSKIYILRLNPSSSIKQVYSWMNKVMEKKYKLMGSYPRRAYEQDQKENLQSLGFCPNGIMQIHLIN